MFSIKKSRSRKILLSLLVLTAILVVVGCAGAPVRGWSGAVVSDDTLFVGSITGKLIALTNVSGNSPRLLWQQPIETSTGGGGFSCGGGIATPMSTYGTPAVADGKAYIGGFDGYIYSIIIKDGSIKKLDTGSAIVGSPVVSGDLVFVGNSDGELHALHLDLSPQAEWVFKTEGKIWATPAVDDGVVYVGSTDNKLYAINAGTGAEIWQFVAGGAVLSTPTVVGDTIYIGANDFKFYAIDKATGEEKWAFEAQNWFWTEALVHENVVWVGSFDHNIYALDAATGQKLAEFPTDGRVSTPPVLMNDLNLIVVGSEDGKLYAIDPQEKSIRELRSFDAPILAPLAVDQQNGIVFIHAQDGTHTLYGLRVETGEILWNLSTSGEG